MKWLLSSLLTLFLMGQVVVCKKEILVKVFNEMFVNITRVLYYYRPFNAGFDDLLKETGKLFYILTNFSNPQAVVDGYVFDLLSSSGKSLIRKGYAISKIRAHSRAMVIVNGTSNITETIMMKLSHKAVASVIVDIKYEADTINLNFSDGRNVLIENKKAVTSALFLFKPWTPSYHRPFHVGLFNCSPFVIFNELNEPNHGIEYNLVKHVIKDLPLEYIKMNSSGNQAFAKVRNAVVTKEADIGICAIWMVSGELNETGVVATIFPHDDLCATFLVPRPELYVGFLNPFFPLTPNLWLATFLCIPLMYVTILISNVFLYKMRLKTINVPAALLQIIRILSSGSATGNWNISLKQLLLAWSITCMILTCCYSAGITSSMDVPKYTKSIQTLSDVVEQKLKLVGIPKLVKDVCNNSENPILTKLVDNFIDENKISQHKSFGIFVKLVQDRYVMNSEQLSNTQRTTYKILSECVMNFYLTLLVRINSPFKRFFDMQSILLQQHGIISAWKRNLTASGRFNYMKQFFVSDVQSYAYKPLNMKVTKGAFLFLACGFMLSAVVFFCEIYIASRRNYHVHKRV